MPPPIEEEEEEEEEDIDPDESYCSEQSARDETVLANAGLLIDSSQSVQGRASPERVVSDIPLVVSDVQPTKEMAVSESVSQEFGKRETSLKRKSPPKRSNHGVMAKRRRGNPRALPCVYCARRLANDPKWACHDAVVSQDGRPGYTGTRCSECVGSHVSCCLIPPRAVGPVKALMKAAEEVNKHDGSQNIAVLAAYEAAIGPALRGMVGIGLQSSAKVNEPRKRSRQPKIKKKSKDSGHPSEGDVAANGTLPQASAHRFELGQGNTQTMPDYGSGVYLGVNRDSEPLSGPLQADRGQGIDNVDSAAFEKRERQALRRRKVEALESIAHTAALFLAEFMDFKKGRQDPPATTSQPPGPERHQTDQRAGAAYAAAAASLFRPLSEEIDRSGHNSSDGEDVTAEIPSGTKNGMDMDETESDGTPSELLASLRHGEQENVSRPGVKIEEH